MVMAISLGVFLLSLLVGIAIGGVLFFVLDIAIGLALAGFCVYDCLITLQIPEIFQKAGDVWKVWAHMV